jgi:osmotically inducible lipoprotein OsmB
MRKSILLVALLTAPLAGCMQDPASRGLTGAVAGAALADLTDNNALTGALIGGLAGAATCGVDIGLPACY